MTEKQKRDAGQLYNPNYDKELGIEIMSCKQKCHDYNQLSPADFENKSKLLDDILGSHGQNTMVLSPFWCDYGYNVSVGDNVWIGAGVRVMPGVTIGNNVIIGAGSVVTKDVPDGVMAFGNPCKVYRKLTEEEMK